MNASRSHPLRVAPFATAVVVAFVACTDSQPTGPSDVSTSYAKGGGGPTVDAADPNTATPDTTLDVRVIGTGFVEGSTVEFLLAGQSTPKIVTNSSTFVDGQSIVANITIAVDADIALYDVSVRPPRGRGGIGTEIFSVQQPGGGGPPSSTPLVADVSGLTISNDGSTYTGGEVGVFTTLSGAGIWHLGVESPRALNIGEIRDSGGSLIVPAQGGVEAQLQTVGCCDLWNMTADSAGMALNGSPMPIKLKVRWDTGDGYYLVSMGTNNMCIDQARGEDPPDDDPGRGTWARATRTSDTSWTIESVGPAAVCHFIDEQGKKNDRYVLESTDAQVDMLLQFSTQQ